MQAGSSLQALCHLPIAGKQSNQCNSGYKLELDEVEQLLDQIDTAHTGQVAKSQLAASQMDWQAMQQNHADQWLASVHKVFQSFDTDADGVIASEQILECLRAKLPASEVHTVTESSELLCTCTLFAMLRSGEYYSCELLTPLI